MFNKLRTGVHLSVRTVSLAVIVGCLALLAWSVVDPEHAERLVIGDLPNLFYRESEEERLADYGHVFGVAHNSGDSLAATELALRYGADAIEIDVIAIDGELYAAHLVPPRYAAYFFRGPRLADIWAVARDADVVALDLKQRSPAYLALVVDFLRKHREHQVVISSHDPASLRYIQREAPAAFRFLGIGSRAELEELADDPELLALIDGVGIREDLVTDETAAWINSNGLLMIAWTVNRLERANELVELGVDAITSDNLAILELLGAQQRGEQPLLHRER